MMVFIVSMNARHGPRPSDGVFLASWRLSLGSDSRHVPLLPYAAGGEAAK
ncbi:MAG: hypothetical protein LBU98_01125 [Alistipes sp.]|jgi:hypothetical protein|nr:hypothetical protein [Alistipes sp.]